MQQGASRESMLSEPLVPVPKPRPQRKLLEAIQEQALLLSTASFISVLNDINAASFGQLLVPAALGLPAAAGSPIFVAGTLAAQIILSLCSGEAYAMGGATIEVIPLITPITLLAANDELSTAEKASTLLAMFSLTSLVVSAMYIAIARFKLAGILRCIPLIVLKSALTGVGAFLLIESAKMSINVTEEGPPIITQVGSIRGMTRLLPTIGLYAGLVVVQNKLNSPFAALGYLGMAVGLVCRLRFSELLILGDDWYFGDGKSSADAVSADGGAWVCLGALNFFSFGSISVGALAASVPYAISCAFVHALVTVTDLVALEAASTAAAAEAGKEPSFDLDREISSIGLANFASACLGGMPNYMQLTPSMVSLKFTRGSGGRPGPYVAILTALSLPFLSSVVAIVPRFVVGAFILDMGVGFLMETGLETLRHTIDPIDKLLIFLVPTIMVTVEFLPGLATGLFVALCHFVVSCRPPVVGVPLEPASSASSFGGLLIPYDNKLIKKKYIQE